ncbi:hypothetical protein DFH06DRAFT_1121235 [Mycena polygramma]|nr:hypothetical protein DFH06DRAFT_1121235 [Mycena polygramma]
MSLSYYLAKIRGTHAESITQPPAHAPGQLASSLGLSSLAQTLGVLSHSYVRSSLKLLVLGSIVETGRRIFRWLIERFSIDARQRLAPLARVHRQREQLAPQVGGARGLGRDRQVEIKRTGSDAGPHAMQGPYRVYTLDMNRAAALAQCGDLSHGFVGLTYPNGPTAPVRPAPKHLGGRQAQDPAASEVRVLFSIILPPHLLDSLVADATEFLNTAMSLGSKFWVQSN